MNLSRQQAGSKWIGFVWLQNFNIIIYVSVCEQNINVLVFRQCFCTEYKNSNFREYMCSELKILIPRIFKICDLLYNPEL